MSAGYNKPPVTREPYMTLAEIADIMGMSRERVRQIEESALRKARKVLRKRGMTAEDFFATLKYTQPIKASEDENPSSYELMYEKEDKND